VACSVATTCAPSPTAAATRLIEPERTSPIAKIPRRLVSSGLRVSLQSPPVSTKPLASNATPDPDSHPVFRSAPMNKNRWLLRLRTRSPDPWQAARLQHSVAALQTRDLRLRQHFHVRQAGNSIDQVARHARRKFRPAHKQPHFGDMACEINGCLSGG